MNIRAIIEACDFTAALLFVLGLKRMSSPVTACSGIISAGAGMLIATLASFLLVFDVTTAARPHLSVNIALAVIALAVGLTWASWTGRRVSMRAMPQMVALYNGMGGGAAAAIAAGDLVGRTAPATVHVVVSVGGTLIGAVSLSGSLIAWAKLDGRITKAWQGRGMQLLSGLLLLGTVGIGLCLIVENLSLGWITLFFIGALVYGMLATIPIGGADMPVVISFYNACTGLAVAADGFVLQSPALMIGGMLVGSAGTLLTLLMAKAMNRTVTNVLFGHFSVTSSQQHIETKGRLKPVEASDAATTMRYARQVIIVPGYGLAVAQAQHKLYEFVKLLEEAGVEVKFAVHPVAGRMPGHMDVLLAEAGVPYDMMHELEDINEEFGDCDVALVIGANDVVNPAARTDKSSPIYGMPILNADHARQVYVIKRGEGKGYSGIENELFYAPNCNMVYGDARAVLVKMIEALRALETAEGASRKAA